MDDKISLFSRARPGKPVHKKIRGFLALPGELRNEVYEHYFREDFRCEIVREGTDLDLLGHRMSKLGYAHPPRPKPKLGFQPAASSSIRISRRLGKHTHIEGLRTSWWSSLCALILVCKQIHRESIVFLYCKTIFVFNAPKRINNFLRTFPATNLALVTKLELHYATYGNPDAQEHHHLREKSLATWTRVCKAAAKQLVNLQKLQVWLYVTDSPLFFDLRQDWLSPLLPFRRSCLANQTKDTETGLVQTMETASKGLRLVDIQFDTWWSRAAVFDHIPSLNAACIDLHGLFGEAISRAILGASEEEAMADFREAWEGKYAQWKHHLRFSTTGW